MVSGLCWTSDLRDVGDNPVNRLNIAYVVHCYPISSTPWETYWGYLKDTYPIIVTEWGYPLSEQGTQTGYGEPLVDYLASKEIGWTAWCFHPTWMPNLLQNWNGDLTEYGQLVRDNL